MEALNEILQHEFSAAMQVKDPKSLQNCIRLMTQSFLQKDEYNQREDLLLKGQQELKSDIRLILQRMEHTEERFDRRFATMDQRFEQMEKRFEQVDKRFESLEERFQKRFEQTEKRFEAIDRKFAKQTTMMMMGFGFVTVLITVLKFLF